MVSAALKQMPIFLKYKQTFCFNKLIVDRRSNKGLRCVRLTDANLTGSHYVQSLLIPIIPFYDVHKLAGERQGNNRFSNALTRHTCDQWLTPHTKHQSISQCLTMSHTKHQSISQCLTPNTKHQSISQCLTPHTSPSRNV